MAHNIRMTLNKSWSNDDIFLAQRVLEVFVERQNRPLPLKSIVQKLGLPMGIDRTDGSIKMIQNVMPLIVKLCAHAYEGFTVTFAEGRANNGKRLYVFTNDAYLVLKSEIPRMHQVATKDERIVAALGVLKHSGNPDHMRMAIRLEIFVENKHALDDEIKQLLSSLD